MLHAVTPFRRAGLDKKLKQRMCCLQVCLLDLDYNLPVQVRDSALTEEGAELAALPESDVGKEYALQKMSEDGTLGAAYTKQQASDTILRLQRTGPYYKVRNCSSQLCVIGPRPQKCKTSFELPTYPASAVVVPCRGTYDVNPLICSGRVECIITDTCLHVLPQRNQAQLCSFFVKGECKRGAECPYRHEMPTSGPLANQNIKDRYGPTRTLPTMIMLSC